MLLSHNFLLFSRWKYSWSINILRIMILSNQKQLKNTTCRLVDLYNLNLKLLLHTLYKQLSIFGTRRDSVNYPRVLFSYYFFSFYLFQVCNRGKCSSGGTCVIMNIILIRQMFCPFCLNIKLPKLLARHQMICFVFPFSPF